MRFHGVWVANSEKQGRPGQKNHVRVDARWTADHKYAHNWGVRTRDEHTVHARTRSQLKATEDMWPRTAIRPGSRCTDITNSHFPSSSEGRRLVCTIVCSNFPLDAIPEVL